MKPAHTACGLLARAALLLLVLAPAGGSAQPTPQGAGAEPAPAETAPETSLAEVVGQAGEAEAKLRQIESGLALDPTLVEVADRLPEYLEQLAERAGAALERVEQVTQLRQLSDIEKVWLAERT